MRIKWFSFLEKVAFISNIFFVLDIALAHFSFIKLPQFIIGFSLVIGWFPISPLINFSVTFSLLLLVIKGKRNAAAFWLVAVNLFFFFAQIFYFILTPG
jgi:hypothetical protein